MKNQIVFSGIAVLLFSTGCSGLKTMSSANNFDDAYFSPKDLSSAGIYAQGKAVETPLTPAQRVSGSASYGQSYSDRLRNFGSSSVQQPFRPAMVIRPMAPGLYFARPMMANPNMWGYNPYNPYSFYNPYNGFYGPYGMNGMNNWNPYMGFNDPYWMYYNQMYNPYCYYGGYNYAPRWNTGSSGNGTRVARNSGSSFTGARSGTANSGSSFNNSGTRRTSFNNGTSSGSTYRSGSTSGSEYGTGRTSTWNSGSSSGSSGTGRTTTWGSGSSGSSSGSSGRSSTWSSGSSPSGSSRSGSAAQPGTSGRRR